MSLDLDRLMDNARIHLPGALDSTLKLEMYNVLNDFFQNSNIWQEEIEFEVTTSALEYSIEATSVSSIVRLVSLVDTNNSPVGATMAEPGELILDTAPSQDTVYTATVALTVDSPVARSGFPEFPAWILDKYHTGLLDGLLARMMAQPAKPYSNLPMAATRYRSFRIATAQAGSESVRKNLSNAQAWRFPQNFARTR